MDYSYLLPRCVQLLYDGVLLSSAAECRLALHLLECDHTAAGAELRVQLRMAVEQFEQELVRRGVH